MRPAELENTLNLKSNFDESNAKAISPLASTSTSLSLSLGSSGSMSSTLSSASECSSRKASPSQLINDFKANMNIQNELHHTECSNAVSHIDKFFFRPSDTLSLLKYNLDNLSLNRKDTVLFLIEKNLRNHIVSPFDQLAYMRMRKLGACAAYRNLEFSREHDYNYKSITQLHKFMLKLNRNLLNKKYLTKNNLLCGCVSMFLMPFFFDIFKPTEVQTFSQTTVDTILQLKRAYKTEMHLRYDSLISYFEENIVWNCIVLYKYKFGADSRTRMGYLNFYMSFVYILIHLRSVALHSSNQTVVKTHLRKVAELSSVLPQLLDALIQNGLLTYKDYSSFESFLNKQTPTLLELGANGEPLLDSNANNLISEFKQTYLNMSYKALSSRIGQLFPMKLKHMCRIRVKQLMSTYDSKTVGQLDVSEPVKNMLLFDDELVALHKLTVNKLTKKQ